MASQALENSRFEGIQHDCKLIMEAIRRLIDGTWLLQADDQSYSWELFPKVRDSLLEHVHFEEEALFPSLSARERELHRADHQRMLAQLWAAEKALLETRGEFFQNQLRGLRVLLEEHHQKFSDSAEGDSSDKCCSSCHAEKQILERRAKTTL